MAAQAENDQVLAELRKLQEAASLQRVKDILQREIDRITAESSHRVAPGAPEPTTAPRNTTAAPPAVVVKEIVTYGYDDDDDEYTIVVTQNMENVTKDSVNCQFTAQSFILSVRITSEGGAAPVTEHRLEVRNLFDTIDPTKSRARAGKKQVIITLKKVHSRPWDALTKVEHSLKEKSKPNYNKKKRDADSDDPSAGLMSLMRDMYEQGDDQMKQTIAKAMFESRQKNAAAADMQ